ncbi:replication restart helicase PriA [Desulfosudis oleivorans]|uniref:Replication restart protein PriA n=1 Tax=Desulfosudis oleivorans (strain DSM 6200 / JCM 39069 / Hxd3) TaxID=96561 RepID=A8ZRR8_DESOH|nr:primosomal protein N' [Desulfosudis oleivorans]ABW65835.1 primosomal protein N' [Desulfosudis oleivorans Hxd3]
MSDSRYIEVAIHLPVFQTYTYSVPEPLLLQAVCGRRVQVPFGRQMVAGTVLGEATACDNAEIKPVAAVLDDGPLFPATMIPFFRWVADYYLYPLGETIANALPAGDLPKKSAPPVGKIPKDAVGDPILPDTPPDLTTDQEAVVADLVSRLDAGFCSCLLAGITGSGKTEVYMRVVAAALAMGKTALVLVPEIALIAQAEHRFCARFGHTVAVLHSGLSRTERWHQWSKIARGEAAIAIGTRSAVFAPLDRPGIIIVDEEHDTSYKQESGLRYNACDLAVVRAKLSDAVVVLGSATPSVQSLHNATTGKFSKTYRMDRRINRQPLPAITVVDLREQQARRGPRAYISDELHRAMAETLAQGNQVLLFLNRRGFASLPVCAACGNTIKCKHCDISLTLHKGANAFRCHFCGYSRAAARGCDICGSSSIKLLGLGTEKVEEAVKQLFPEASVARLDRDTTTRKGAMLRILKDLKNRKIDILVGTQMIAKGHDFPGITLIGVICADLSLNFPDFRAGERTFQLLAQVAGRAGRGVDPGRVILQTYNPDHLCIAAATRQDGSAFYDQEIAFRRQLGYPPFSRMVHLHISATDPAKAKARAREAGDCCTALKNSAPAVFGAVEVLGPVEAPIHKLASRYRWQILLKSRSAAAVKSFAARLLAQDGQRLRKGGVRLVVDVDPFFMM